MGAQKAPAALEPFISTPCAVPFLPGTADLALRNPEEPRGRCHCIPQVKDRPGTCGCCDPRAHALSTATAAWAICRGARAGELCGRNHSVCRVPSPALPPACLLGRSGEALGVGATENLSWDLAEGFVVPSQLCHFKQTQCGNLHQTSEIASFCDWILASPKNYFPKK